MKKRLCALVLMISCLFLLVSCRKTPQSEQTPDATAETVIPTPLPTPTPPAPAPEVPNTKLPILMYHDVVQDGQPCGSWTVTDSRFREDLQWLTDNGYTAISAAELAAGAPLPERAVLITFDDGYKSNYELAFPILVEYRMKAVISLIGHHIDDKNEWFLTWDQCRQMQDSGFVEFGSHTYDQHTLDKCVQRMPDEDPLQYGARVFADVQKSIDRMETELGVPVIFLAYPNGRYDPWSDAFMAEHFQVTVSTDFGTADLSNGLYKLPRYNINMDDPVSKYLPSLNNGSNPA